MKIAVCIKQVPVVSRIRFDYESKTILREGVPLEVNSFDLLAVDRAVELGREARAQVVVLTMGPPQAREALIQCLAMGADRAVHLTDRAMAGSDTLATARSLALALKREGFEPEASDWLIFCGRNSTDAETGQVGPEIAELLKVPHVSNVRRLEYSTNNGTTTVERVTDEGYEVIRCPLPALVSVAEGIMPERWPSRQDMEAAKARAEAQHPSIEEVGAAQLSSDNSLFGSAGSPTWVAEIRLIEPQRLGVVIEEADPQVAAQKLVEGLLKKNATATAPEKRGQAIRYPGHRERAIWVMAERAAREESTTSLIQTTELSRTDSTRGTNLRKTTFELLGKARELAQHTRSEVAAVVIGRVNDIDVKALAAYGADRIYVLDGSHLGHPTGLASSAALVRAVERLSPYAVLFPSTANGRDIASRVAARLGLGLTGDCVDLEINERGELVQLKPALGGNVVAPILSRTSPYMATLRPGLLTPAEPDWDFEAEEEMLEVLPIEGPDLTVLEVYNEEDARGLELESARVVMAVGMGVGGRENLPTIYKLADSIGATVAASRNVTDAGWLPKQVQVGLTGRAIAPEVYIAVGVRGDFNHMVGVQKAGTILAINNNPNPRRTPILQAADFSVVGDWQTYLPPLVDALKPIVLANS